MLLALQWAHPVLAGPEGRIAVIDGDTIEINGVRVRLHGIDAPERDQTCSRGEGVSWDCGAWVTREVRRLFEGRIGQCEARGTDRYGRTIGRCMVEAEDMAAVIVRSGLAEAYLKYSRDYLDAEKAAQVAGRGIFSGPMASPEDHRAGRVGTEAIPDGCPIKGNISSGGRIYHMPGQADYGRTRIAEARGERWFCSEAEARAAGWRRARR
ncbi:MAG: thermonuclease family protein [Pseudomonadota bacterium]